MMIGRTPHCIKFIPSAASVTIRLRKMKSRFLSNAYFFAWLGMTVSGFFLYRFTATSRCDCHSWNTYFQHFHEIIHIVFYNCTIFVFIKFSSRDIDAEKQQGNYSHPRICKQRSAHFYLVLSVPALCTMFERKVVENSSLNAVFGICNNTLSCWGTFDNWNSRTGELRVQ